MSVDNHRLVGSPVPTPLMERLGAQRLGPGWSAIVTDALRLPESTMVSWIAGGVRIAPLGGAGCWLPGTEDAGVLVVRPDRVVAGVVGVDDAPDVVDDLSSQLIEWVTAEQIPDP
jgi:hypothetical protein